MVSAYHWMVFAADGTSTASVSRMGLPTSSDSSSASSSRFARIRLGELEQDALAVGRRLVGPAAIVEGGPGGRDRAVDVLDVALGDVGDHASRRGPAMSGNVWPEAPGRTGRR